MWGKISDNISIAFASILNNRVRALITMFIIGLGIMALVSMLTAVDGIKGALFKGFADVGANTFTITSEDPLRGMREGGMARMENEPIRREAREFQRRFEADAEVSIFFNALWDAVVKFGPIKTPPKIEVTGTDQNYLAAKGIELANGRNFVDKEVQMGRNVVLIGSKLKEDIFGTNEAAGKSIRINNKPYLIIGELEEQGSSFGESVDNTLIVPDLAARNDFASNDPEYSISVQVKKAEELDKIIDEATGLFRILRGLKIAEENNFSVTKSDNLAEILEAQIAVIKIIAFIIGFITLAGAAVGLTNIMLVSVTERTREIGVRKAMGATTKDIRTQFLWEAVVICFAGGFIGVIIGIFLGNLVAEYFEGDFILPWNWIIFGLVICILVGIVAGLYPAVKAARLDPIESLRHE